MSDYRVKYKVFRKIGFKAAFVNFLFQRVFRKGSRNFFGVNFTSNISESGIDYHKDLVTLTSFSVSGNCYFQAINGIVLGKNCLFAPGVKLISADHDFKNLGGFKKTRPIIIGDDVWIGTSVVILPGVQIGNNCVIGAGSVVTKSFCEDGIVIAGNPAKKIKNI